MPCIEKLFRGHAAPPLSHGSRSDLSGQAAAAHSDGVEKPPGAAVSVKVSIAASFWNFLIFMILPKDSREDRTP
jgi:hypothetical protein